MKQKQPQTQQNKPHRNDLDNTEPRWFVFSVVPNCERAVQKSLTKAGITAYVPLKQETRLSNTAPKRTRTVDVVLIPAYVFAQITYNEYIAIRDFKHIVRIVAIGGELICISDAEIDWLKQLTASKQTIEIVPNKEIEVGKKIKISNGKPFAGHEGFVVEQYGKKRFGVLLLPLQILVITDIDNLEEVV